MAHQNVQILCGPKETWSVDPTVWWRKEIAVHGCICVTSARKCIFFNCKLPHTSKITNCNHLSVCNSSWTDGLYGGIFTFHWGVRVECLICDGCISCKLCILIYFARVWFLIWYSWHVCTLSFSLTQYIFFSYNNINDDYRT